MCMEVHRVHFLSQGGGDAAPAHRRSSQLCQRAQLAQLRGRPAGRARHVHQRQECQSQKVTVARPVLDHICHAHAHAHGHGHGHGHGHAHVHVHVCTCHLVSESHRTDLLFGARSKRVGAPAVPRGGCVPWCGCRGCMPPNCRLPFSIFRRSERGAAPVVHTSTRQRARPRASAHTRRVGGEGQNCFPS